MLDKKDWLQNRCEEIALDKTGHEFHTLGPQMQLMCYMKAEEDWIDYYSDQIDSTYERIRDQQLGI